MMANREISRESTTWGEGSLLLCLAPEGETGHGFYAKPHQQNSYEELPGNGSQRENGANYQNSGGDSQRNDINTLQDFKKSFTQQIAFLSQAQSHQEQIDQLDPDKRGYQATQAIDEQVIA